MFHFINSVIPSFAVIIIIIIASCFTMSPSSLLFCEAAYVSSWDVNVPGQITRLGDVYKICTPQNPGTSKVCYVNRYGNFHFLCDNAKSLVRLYQCDDLDCTTNCNIIQNFTEAVTTTSYIELTKTYNWTGVYYTLANSQYITSATYSASDPTLPCNSTFRQTVDQIPASSLNCLIWSSYSSASQQWTCSSTTAPITVTNTQYLISANCKNTTTVTSQNSGDCTNSNTTSWTCKTLPGIQVVVFARRTGATAVSTAIVVILMSTLLILSASFSTLFV